jgi:hypothetical protein
MKEAKCLLMHAANSVELALVVLYHIVGTFVCMVQVG